MNSHKPLSVEAREFRQLLIDALWSDTAFGYVTQDVIVVRCACCGEDGLLVEFHGARAEADLQCLRHGCSEADIAIAIGGLEAV